MCIDAFGGGCLCWHAGLDWLNQKNLHHGSILNFLLSLSKVDIGEVCPSLEHFISFMNEAHISSLEILNRKYSTPLPALVGNN